MTAEMTGQAGADRVDLDPLPRVNHDVEDAFGEAEDDHGYAGT